MNNASQRVYDILKRELSEITAKSILQTKCKTIGKDLDTLTLEDIKNIKSTLLSSVLLYGGAEKAKAIKENLEALS